MIARQFIALAAALGLTALSASTARADEVTKERIRDTASRIVQEIGESTIGDTQQDDVLRDLRQILAQVRGGGDNNGNGEGLFCKPWSSSSSYVARRSDGVTIGDRVDNAQCRDIIAKARMGLVCEPWSSSSGYVTDLSTMTHIGDRVSFDRCFALVASATRALVCSPWSESSSYVFGRVNHVNIGDRVSTDRCTETVSKSRRGLVCAPWSESSAYITRIATGEQLGDRVSFEQCYQSL